MNLTHTIKHFRELSTHELYAVMRLRNQVFIVEQQCIFLDADNKDLFSYHLLLHDGTELIAYARLLPQGLTYPEMSIGRVVTSTQARGTGAGKKLMELAIKYCHKYFGPGPIRIGAQLYAAEFYSSLGFQQTGAVYDEDGIEHIEMIIY